MQADSAPLHTIAIPSSATSEDGGAHIGEVGFILDLVQAMAGARLEGEALAVADDVTRAVAAKGGATLASLVAAWEKVPQLRAFARSVEVYSRPAAYDRYFGASDTCDHCADGESRSAQVLQ